ncbi:hypothetical protein PSDVSF_16770 [Pseudodesulfovibrio sediminis]|uniref:Amine oxidase domain-containing protein n=2 Tax=Pseudodesulfovibrio sediminis TaxID=2810563 RepID=A0ABN6ET80_9BACT|nr:hypothetical protein PSDVSF_16770 [Pseudodesulfovibrio sediminis]
MTTALLLAKSGAKVALVEKFPLLSPTVRGYSKNGVHFDTGLHYLGGLGDGDPLDIYFKHLDIISLIKKKPYNPGGYDLFSVETSQNEYEIPSGFDELKKRLTDYFPNEADAIAQFSEAIQSTLAASPFLNFDMKFSLEAALHEDGQTLKEFLDYLTDNEELKALLSYQTLLYGSSPDEALLTTHALVAGSYTLSTHTLENGGLALVKAYETRLKELNVDVMCNAAVTHIEIDESRSVTGVSLSNGKEFSTRSCIWTAHPRGLVDATPDNAFRPAFKKRLLTLEDTDSALILFGVSETPLPELEGRNLILWPGQDFADNLKGLLPPEESIIYISAAEDTRSGKTTLTAIMPQNFKTYASWADSRHNNRPKEYEYHKRSILAVFEEEIFRRIPTFRNLVTFVDGATPLTIKDFCATPTGSLYGLRHSVNQFNPAPVTKMTGLTLAGQGIVAPGILGAVVSAYLTCGIILGHEPLHKELRQHT